MKMIRPYRPQDNETLVRLWLEASVAAHHFIPSIYWQQQADAMRHTYLPSARNWVYVEGRAGSPVGFISLKKNYIAALFVAPGSQRKGIGLELLAFAKQKYPSLELSVYAENAGAVAFYRREGFRVRKTGLDEATGHAEYRMAFSGPASRIAREKRVVGVMIRLYCRKKENNPTLCAECAALLAYAETRLDRCPFGEEKTACQHCTVHCYRPAMREKMRAVMRFSGPRMLLYAPWEALRHLVGR